MVMLTVGDRLPHDMTPEAWESFSDYIFGGMNRVSTLCAVALLLCVQFSQTLMCVPFLHITQILIGYYIGAGQAFALSATWEVLMVTAFVLSQQGTPDGKSTLLLMYIAQCRERGRLYVSLMCTMMSSIPLNTSVCLVVFGDVTLVEFLSVHYLVTEVMTLKNVLIGAAIRSQQHSPRTLSACMSAMVFFAVLPSLFTVYLTSSVYCAVTRRGSEALGDAAPLVSSDSDCGSEADLERDLADCGTGADLERDLADCGTGADLQRGLADCGTGTDFQRGLADCGTGTDFQRGLADCGTGTDFQRVLARDQPDCGTGIDLEHAFPDPENDGDGIGHAFPDLENGLHGFPELENALHAAPAPHPAEAPEDTRA